MHRLRLGGHGDRHGEVRQAGEGQPVLLYIGRTRPPRDEGHLFPGPRQIPAENRPQRPCSQDDDLHSHMFLCDRHERQVSAAAGSHSDGRAERKL